MNVLYQFKDQRQFSASFDNFRRPFLEVTLSEVTNNPLHKSLISQNDKLRKIRNSQISPTSLTVGLLTMFFALFA